MVRCRFIQVALDTVVVVVVHSENGILDNEGVIRRWLHPGVCIVVVGWNTYDGPL